MFRGTNSHKNRSESQLTRICSKLREPSASRITYCNHVSLWHESSPGRIVTHHEVHLLFIESEHRLLDFYLLHPAGCAVWIEDRLSETGYSRKTTSSFMQATMSAHWCLKFQWIWISQTRESRYSSIRISQTGAEKVYSLADKMPLCCRRSNNKTDCLENSQ